MVLYKKLMCHNVIPLDFMEAWNALNNYSEQYDEYKALYDILANFHPCLKEDEKIEIANFHDCMDIFQYCSPNMHHIQMQQVNPTYCLHEQIFFCLSDPLAMNTR